MRFQNVIRSAERMVSECSKLTEHGVFCAGAEEGTAADCSSCESRQEAEERGCPRCGRVKHLLHLFTLMSTLKSYGNGSPVLLLLSSKIGVIKLAQQNGMEVSVNGAFQSSRETICPAGVK